MKIRRGRIHGGDFPSRNTTFQQKCRAEAKQARLNNEIAGLEDWAATREEADDSFDRFTALVEKYVDIPELTPAIVNEFIKKIIVYAPEKQGSMRIQKVRIIFSFLEELDMLEIGEPVITETTYGRRKAA